MSSYYCSSLGNDVSVTMSLFDSQAVSFHNKLEVFQVDPRVVVVTSIHKIVRGIFLTAITRECLRFTVKHMFCQIFVLYRWTARTNSSWNTHKILFLWDIYF